MNEVSLMAIRALMAAGGVPEADIELALRIADGGLWVSTPEVCRVLKVKRWLVWQFCEDHNIPVQVRKGRGGNLIAARPFWDKWAEVRGGA